MKETLIDALAKLAQKALHPSDRQYAWRIVVVLMGLGMYVFWRESGSLINSAVASSPIVLKLDQASDKQDDILSKLTNQLSIVSTTQAKMVDTQTAFYKTLGDLKVGQGKLETAIDIHGKTLDRIEERLMANH